MANFSRIVSPRLGAGQPRSSRATVAAPLCRGEQHSAATHVGAQIAHKSDIVNFSAANLIGGLVFGSIGFVAFVYGKRMNLWKPMFLGLGLMIYPYFVSDDKIMLAIGILGSGVLFFFRE
jgi:hypothetical protein